MNNEKPNLRNIETHVKLQSKLLEDQYNNKGFKFPPSMYISKLLALIEKIATVNGIEGYIDAGFIHDKTQTYSSYGNKEKFLKYMEERKNEKSTE